MDFLRSCYSTLAVVTPGQPAEKITWWWAAPDAPLAPRGPWGSLNWLGRDNPLGELGELDGAPRPWRDGSKPAGACPEQGLVTPCSADPVPLTLFATFANGTDTAAFQIAYNVNTDRWEGTAGGLVGSCKTFSVHLTCLEQAGLPTQWQLQVAAGVNPGVFGATDQGNFPPLGAGQALNFVLDCPDCSELCGGLDGPLVTCTVTANLPGRLSLPLHVS